MELTLDVSRLNEGTADPWWMILDPGQNMNCDIFILAEMITGPFFSREEANQVLKERKHHYSNRARVFCASGCYTHQYSEKYRQAESTQPLSRRDKELFDSLQEGLHMLFEPRPATIKNDTGKDIDEGDVIRV